MKEKRIEGVTEGRDAGLKDGCKVNLGKTCVVGRNGPQGLHAAKGTFHIV